MDPVSLAVKQPVTVAVGVLLVVLAGTLALGRLPIQLTPTVDQTVVTVTTFWEGASPEEIERNVVDKQEERLLGLSNLRLLTSESIQNTGSIRLEFITGTDKDSALREVSDKLREVPDYPEGVDEPVISDTDSENRDYIAWVVLGSTDSSFDVRVLRDFAIDRIEPALERVPGVAEINVLGGRERELRVVVDPVRLAQYGITPTALADSIRGTNRNVSGGEVLGGRRDYRVRTVAQYTTIDEVESTVVAHGAGGPVYLRDVATVELTFKDPPSFVRSKGRSVIAINADREIGSNIITVMEAFKAELARLNAEGGPLDLESKRLGLEGKLYLDQVFDQTVYIDDAIALVRSNIFIGGSLAVLVLLLFLRSLRTVGIIAIAIPISIVGAVVAMVLLGRSINVVSLAGMAFAVGMVVDNAIVVLENIFRHLEMGKPAVRAAHDGAREVWGAVLAATLTTIVVFVPILLVQEEAGQLFRDIALAICAAVALSLVVSVTVIPAAAAGMLRPRSRPTTDVQSGGFGAAVGRFVYAMSGSTVLRVLVIGVLTVVAVGGSIWLMPPVDYLPAGNRNLVFGLIIPPPATSLEHRMDMALRMEATIRPFWEAGDRGVLEGPTAVPISQFDPTAGEITPPAMENYFVVSFGDILFQGGVSADPARVVDMKALMAHATRSSVLPGARSFPFQVPLFRLGGATGSAVKVQLADADLDRVVAAAEPLYRALGAQFGYGNVKSTPGNFNLPAPELRVRPDLERLGEVGLTPRDIGMAVQAAGDGAIIDEYTLGGDTVDLKLIATEHGIASADRLLDLPLATRSGHIVPLGSLATIETVNSMHSITRVGRRRSVTFEVTAPEGMPLESLVAAVKKTVADLRAGGRIPPAIETTYAGSASRLTTVRDALLGDGTMVGTISSSLFLALVVVYLLMCVLFQSFLQPLIIMFTVPLATLGGFLALRGVFIWSSVDRYMPKQTLDVLTMLGFILLIGVVVNNAILIVHQTRNFMAGRGDAGVGEGVRMEPRRAIAEAVRTRVRPIFMSQFTSIGGMLPLVLMPGSGSELYRGLGSVVVGGLLVSTVFTLLLVPLLLSLLFDIRPPKLTSDEDLAGDQGQAASEAAEGPVRAPVAAASARAIISA